MEPIFLIVGAAMLILGRKLFWLFVGGVGFMLGMTLLPQLLPGQSDTMILTIALIAALLGAVLAILLQKVAVGIAGFVAGGYIIYHLIGFLSLDIVGSYIWFAVAAGGILGAILAGSMFDWALILLSSASGAVLIANNLQLPNQLSLVLLVGLFIVGIIVQGNIKKKD